MIGTVASLALGHHQASPSNPVYRELGPWHRMKAVLAWTQSKDSFRDGGSAQSAWFLDKGLETLLVVGKCDFSLH